MAKWRQGNQRTIRRSGFNVFDTMGLWFKALRGQRYAITSVNSNGVEVVRLVDYDTYCEEGYKRNATLFACTRMLATSAPTARMQISRRLERGQTEIYENHPLQAVLDMPNPRQSYYDFTELRETYYHLDGNIFILIEREKGRTKALWLPRPDRMTPIVDRSKAIYEPDALAGYVYRPQNFEPIYFLPEDVIHIKFPNPNDPYGGLGRGVPPVMAAASDVDNDNSQTSFIKQFFKNGAVPSGIIKSKNILDDAEVKRIQHRMEEQYTGEQNWHKVMVLDADAEFQKTGLNLDEMVFPDLRAISEARICSVMGVAAILVGAKAGLDAATYSNYKLARSAMWEDHIMTNNQKTAEAFTRAFSSELGENVIIQHDYSKVVALQQDRSERFTRSNQAILGGWITVNEGRREVGLAPLPMGVGDVIYRPLMIEAVDDGEGDASQKVLKSQVIPVGKVPPNPPHPTLRFRDRAGGIKILPSGFKGFSGSMIAFHIPEIQAAILADSVSELPEGSKRTALDEFHITLALTTHPDDEAVIEAIKPIVENVTAIEGKTGGLIQFSPDPEGFIPLCTQFDSPWVTQFRESIMDALRQNGIEPLMTHGFTPHITLAYVPKDEEVPIIDVPEIPLRFEEVTLFDRNGVRTSIPFGNRNSNLEDSQSQRDKWGAVIWKRFDRIARAWEKKFQDKATAIFRDEARGVEAAIRTLKSGIKSIPYDDIHKAVEAWLAANGIETWAAGFEPLMLALTEEQMADWGAALGIDWTIDNPAVASFIRQYSYEFAERISTTTHTEITGMMLQAQEEGWSISRMIDEVRSIYGGWSEDRAEMIARSETIRASNAGETEAFREAGIVTEEWYASIDERTCPFCAEMHEKQISVGGVWHAAGSEMVVDGRRLVMDYGDVKYPPLHPDCRCTLLPVVLEKVALMYYAIKASGPTSHDVGTAPIPEMGTLRLDADSA